MKRRVHWFLVAILLGSAIASSASDQKASVSDPITPPRPSLKIGFATVRTVAGESTYTIGGKVKPLKVNLELQPGTVVQTCADSRIYLNINGLSSTVLLEPQSCLVLIRMETAGSPPNQVKQTKIELQQGTILCAVKKVEGGSSYEVQTANGTAAVRGTDFQVAVSPLPGERNQARFLCVSGELLVSSYTEGNDVIRLLRSGEEWTPGSGGVTNCAAFQIEQFQEKMTPVCNFGPSAFPLPTVVIQQPYAGNGPPNPALFGRSPTGMGLPGPVSPGHR